ncbi:MAG: D-alanyl-D-alanine carboxypeptidase family protein [Candidatus Limnocylindria bacterium]
MKALAPALLVVAGALVGCSTVGVVSSPAPTASVDFSAAAGRSPSPSPELELPPEVVAGPDPELGPPPAPEIAALTLETPGAGVAEGGPPDDGYIGDYCVPRDWLTPHLAYSDYARTVVDPTYMVTSYYEPPDLVAVSGARFGGETSHELVRAVAIDDLASLRTAAEAAGAPIDVLSGYRSYAQQEATFTYWWGILGYEAAVHRAARPGHSEHQLGTSLDFSSPGWTGRFGDWATESPSGAWMAQHAWEFGFMMSYPAGGDLATCYGYEPWHYRWIGREAANAVHASGVTLQEFLIASDVRE